MNNILEMIKNEKVEWKKLETLINYEQPTKYIVKSTEYDDRFDTPVLTAGQTFILGFTDELENIYKADENNPVIIFDDFTAGNHWVDFNFKVKSSAMKILKPKEGVNFRYCYHYLKTIQIDISEHKRLWLSKFSKIEIPIPSLETQERIVKILDTMVDHFTQLEAELEARNKQYEYYRDKLLSEEYLNKLTKKFGENTECKNYILNEVSYYPKEKIEINKLDIDNYVGVDNLLQNKLGKCESNYLPKDGKVNIFKKGDVLVGNIRPYLKKIWFADVEGGANGDVLIFRINDDFSNKITPEYLYHNLADDKFFEYNISYSKGAKMPRGDKNKIMEYNIIVPPIPVQKHIVSVLDNFNKIVTDINEGLPKEIELRQKQYEYYRERLLDFKRDDDE